MRDYTAKQHAKTSVLISHVEAKAEALWPVIMHKILEPKWILSGPI